MSALIISMIAGAIGTGYFIYGKKQQKGALLLAGVALGIYPYFITNPVALVLVGLALMVAPFLVDFF